MSKKWTKAEERLLREKQGKMSAAELARKLTVTPRQIKKKLLELAPHEKRGAKTKHKRETSKRARGRTGINGRPTAIAEAQTFAHGLRLFDKGVELFNARRFDKAQKIFTEILDTMPEEKEFQDRARLYLNLIQRQQRPAEPRVRNYEDYYNRAIYFLNLGDYDKSLGYLKKAHEKKPRDPSITYFLALAFAGKNDPKASLAHLKQAVELDGENRVLARNEAEFQALVEFPEFRQLLYPEKSGSSEEQPGLS